MLPPILWRQGDEVLVFRAELVVADRPSSLDDTHLGLFLTLEEGADSAVVDLRCSKGLRPSTRHRLRHPAHTPADPWKWSGRRRIGRGERWGKARLLTLRDLRSVLLPSKRLRVSMRLLVGSAIRARKRHVASLSGAPAKCFGQQLLESKSSADVAFVVQRRGEKKTFPVHKLVLTSRSEVFSVMFGNPDTQESKSMSVVIKDMGFKAAEDFLQLMYTDKCEALEDGRADIERLKKLLRAVEKYQVQQRFLSFAII